MSTVSCINRGGCPETTYDFFTQSPVGITASLVVEAVTLIIGILAITHVLPGIGTIPGAVFTTLGGIFLVITIALVCLRYSKKEKKNSFDNHSIISSETTQSEKLSKIKSIHVTTDTISKESWKEKLELICAQNQETISHSQVDLPPEDCLNTLCLLTQTGASLKLFKNPISHMKPVHEKMQALWKECQGKTGEELYLSVANAFLENLPIINAFVRAQTQTMLFQQPEEEVRNHFKLLNKKIRMILLFLLEHEPKKKDYLKYYQTSLPNTFDNCSWDFFERLCSMGNEKTEALNEFLYLFSFYRRLSLLHAFPKKITQRTQCNDVTLRTILRATWFHGTRALTTLGDTDYTLIPTGWLHQIGCTSFFGEMQDGCKKNGYNANAVSGTSLDDVQKAINTYALGFQFDIKEEIKQIDFFLKLEINTEHKYFHCDFVQLSSFLPRLDAALRRLARWDQEAFKEKIPQLQSTLKLFDDAITLIEERKPSEIFYHRDQYYATKYKNLIHSVNQLKTLLDETPPSSLTQKQRENIEQNIPAVLGSLTLLPKEAPNKSEYLVSGTVQMGKDVQFLCVEKSNVKKATKWVKANLPSSNIKIFSFEELLEARKINKKVGPYLADIFSLNKFNQLCLATAN